MNEYHYYQICYELLSDSQYAKRFPKDAQLLKEGLFKLWLYAIETGDWGVFEIEFRCLWELVHKYL